MNIGFESLKIIRDNNNHSYSGTNIVFDKAVNCWMRGVESENATYKHLCIKKSAHIEISGCYFHEAVSYGVVISGDWTKGTGYGLTFGYSSTNCLVENNIFKNLRHAILLGEGANCNVIAYNYSRDRRGSWLEVAGGIPGDLCLHGRYAYSNLFEQNYVELIDVDDTHGLNGRYNAFMRNKVRDDNIPKDSYIYLDNIDYVSLLGNMLGRNEYYISVFHSGVIFSKDLYGVGIYSGQNYETGTTMTHNQLSQYDYYHRFYYHMFDVSYYYSDKPIFVTEDFTWPSLGPIAPNAICCQTIPARERYDDNIYTYNSNPTPHPQPVSGTQSGTWSGCIIVKGNVSVPNGSTLNIEPGTVVVFDGYYEIRVMPGASILANGTSEAPILFTNASRSLDNKWKFILLYDGNSEFNHCTFEYGYYPVYLYYCTSGECTPNRFENCVFRNNYAYHLRLYRSVAEVVACELKDSEYHGLYSYCSDVDFTGNKIFDNNSFGVYSNTSNNLDFYGNVIEGNGSYGLKTGNSDRINLGDYSWHGYNTVRDNLNWEIYASSGEPILEIYHSSIHGSGGSDYVIYNNSLNNEEVIVWDCWRGTDNAWQTFGQVYVALSNNGVPSWDGDTFTGGPLSKGSIPQINKDDFLVDPSLPNDEQIELCRNIIASAPNSKEAVKALTIQYGILRSDFIGNELNHRDEFYEYLENLWDVYPNNKLGQRALRYLILWHMLGGNDNQVVELSNKALKMLSKEDGGLVLGDLAMTYLHQGNLEDAKTCLDELKKHSDADADFIRVLDEDILEAERQNINKDHNLNKIATADDSDLIKTYPNPGNPTTSIHYRLLKTSRVKINVFNMLGQKIQTLVNEVKDAGNYSITWHGLDRSGHAVSSGLYLISMEYAGKVMTQKVTILR